jgi:rRNA maturation endonuclease Nob1
MEWGDVMKQKFKRFMRVCRYCYDIFKSNSKYGKVCEECKEKNYEIKAELNKFNANKNWHYYKLLTE